jgi:starch synthase
MAANSFAREPLRVLFLSAEAEPLVKVGGLGDVAGSLPRALRRLGVEAENGSTEGPAIDVRLAIPNYGMIALQRTARSGERTLHAENDGPDCESSGPSEPEPVGAFSVPHAGGAIRAEVFQVEAGGVPVYLIGGAPIPSSAPVYSLNTRLDSAKFTFFSLAALELTRLLGWAPDVVHANDWHTAPAVYALRAHPDPFFKHTATIMMVHNLPYMGDGGALGEFGLPPVAESPLPWWARDLPLPLGLLAADQIVAPSPTYAREILTPEFGSGLDAFLRYRSESVRGILNGIDTECWDPETDAAISARFSRGNLERRAADKAALLAELGLEAKPEAPLLVMITRLDTQKGVDLVPEALRQLDDLPWQAVILGTGLPDLEAQVSALQAEYPRRVRALIRFDPALSRRIYAGGDILLVPSRYEPCGLNQMIAMRYGCVPAAHAVGGLFDSIHDWDQSEEGTGFLFGEATPSALAGALRRAMLVYRDRDAWRELQRRGMLQDFSWDRSAQQYRELYQSLAISTERST